MLTHEERREAHRRANAKYYRTKKGKISKARAYLKYRLSKHGKKKRAEYQRSARGKAATKKYVQSAKGKATRNKIKIKNAHKIKVRAFTNNAIRDGRLIPKPCRKCGSKKVEAHHPDYSKPLKIIWLCEKHHLEIHGKKFFKQKRKHKPSHRLKENI